VCNAKKIIEKTTFFVFQKNGITECLIFRLLLVDVVSDIVREKNWGHHAYFPATQSNKLF
jgi:hypothetical protein